MSIKKYISLTSTGITGPAMGKGTLSESVAMVFTDTSMGTGFWSSTMGSWLAAIGAWCN